MTHLDDNLAEDYITICTIGSHGYKYKKQSMYKNADSTKILPIFGMIILLINSDEPYFVCEVLETEEFSSHFHNVVVQRDSILQAKQHVRLPDFRIVQLTTLS